MVENCNSQLFPNQLLVNPALGIRYRLSQRGDWREIHAACYPERNILRFRRRFRRLSRWQLTGRAVVIVAERIGGLRILGCGQMIYFAGYAEIANLSVEPSYQNRGVGTAIMTLLTACASSAGVPRVEIGVAADNLAALSLYRRLGFGHDRLLRTPKLGQTFILSKEL